MLNQFTAKLLLCWNGGYPKHTKAYNAVTIRIDNPVSDHYNDGIRRGAGGPDIVRTKDCHLPKNFNGIRTSDLRDD